MNQRSDNGRPDGAPRGLAILGATGSVGTQILEVVRMFPDRFDVKALACGANVELLADQVREFRPECVAVGVPERAPALEQALPGAAPDLRIVTGPEGLCDVATRSDVDVVMG